MTPLRRLEFERLAREQSAAVYRTARRIVGADALAEDVTQDVFLRVLKRPETYLDRGDVDAERALRWLAVKLSLEVLRQGRNRKRREGVAMEIEERRGDRTPDPREGSEEKEARGALAGALTRLPEELRLAVVLRFQENLSFSEIATATAISEGSAHDRVKRGLEKLRSWMAGAGFGALAMTLERDLAAAEAPWVPAELATRMAALGSSAAAGVGASASASGATLMKVGSLAAALLGTATLLGLGTGAEARWATETPSLVTRSEGNKEVTAVDPPLRTPVVTTRDEAGSSASETTAAAESDRVAAPAPTVPGAEGDPQDPFANFETATIEGRVTLHRDDSVQPSAIRVAAVSLRHRSKGERTRWSTAVEDDGTYSLSVPVEADGAFFQTWIEYDEVVLAHGAETKVLPKSTIRNHDFVFGKQIGERAGEFELTVVVTDARGAPLAAESCVLYRTIEYVGDEPYSQYEYGGVTDANGRLRMTGRFLGRKKLTIGPWMGANATRFVDFTIDRAGRHERTFVMSDLETTTRETGSESPRFSVSGKVIDRQSGEPVLDVYHSTDLVAPPEGMSEDALRTDWLPNAPWTTASRQVQIDGDAKPSEQFSDSTWKAGVYYLVMWRHDYAPLVSGPFDMIAKSSIDEVTLALEKRATMRGRVLDGDGAPLVNAHVVITGLGPFSDQRIDEIDSVVVKQSGDGYTHGSAARTDANGEFELNSAPIGIPFRLVALHPKFQATGSGWWTMNAGSSRDDVELRLITPRQ